MTICNLCGHEIKWHYHDTDFLGVMNGAYIYPCEATAIDGKQCGCIAIQTSLGFAIAKGYDSYPYCQGCASVGRATNDWAVSNWVATCKVCGATVDLKAWKHEPIWLECQRCGHSMKDHHIVPGSHDDPEMLDCKLCTCLQLRRLTDDGYVLESIPVHDPVDHPPHYGGDTTYEAIKVIEAWGLNFNLGNVVKYICRIDKKGLNLDNLEKARWYLEREIARLRQASQG